MAHIFFSIFCAFLTHVLPLVSFYSSSSTVILCYLMRAGFFFVGLGSMPLTLNIPTLAGSLYTSINSNILKSSISIIAITLFLLHPVGAGCWWYTTYWIIPIGCAFYSRSIFLTALGSTFTTHAVGTVFWIYTHSTTSSYWHMLFARVWLERLSIAVMLTVAYYLIEALKYSAFGTMYKTVFRSVFLKRIGNSQINAFKRILDTFYSGAHTAYCASKDVIIFNASINASSSSHCKADEYGTQFNMRNYAYPYALYKYIRRSA